MTETCDIEVRLTDVWGDDKAIAHQAWASSYDVEKLAQKSEADVRRVVTQVVQHVHGTPKERIWCDFFIRCPIFVERQLDKYRMTVQYQDMEVDFLATEMGRQNITQNELSGRYRTLPGRYLDLPDDVDSVLMRSCKAVGDPAYSFRGEWRSVMTSAYEWYADLLAVMKDARESGDITQAEYKRAREVIRGVVGTAFMTDMRIICNLHALEWIGQQRLASDTQPESTQVVAQMVHQAHQKLPTAVGEMIKRHGWEDVMAKYTGVKK